MEEYRKNGRLGGSSRDRVQEIQKRFPKALKRHRSVSQSVSPSPRDQNLVREEDAPVRGGRSPARDEGIPLSRDLSPRLLGHLGRALVEYLVYVISIC